METSSVKIAGNAFPKLFIWTVAAICTLPFLLNLSGVDFGSQATPFPWSDSAEMTSSAKIDAMFYRLSGAFSHTLLNLTVVNDGVEALDYLRKQNGYAKATRPDLILLDLNMPRKDGREVLAELKIDDNLKTIPVVVLTISEADQDILKSYELGCNCYVTKPVGLGTVFTGYSNNRKFLVYRCKAAA